MPQFAGYSSPRRDRPGGTTRRGAGRAVLAATAIMFAAAGVAGARGAAAQSEQVDPRLRESIRWYIGADGTVDDARAHDLLVAALETPSPITTMWLARVHSRGRMHFERDPERAVALAAGVIDEVRGLAESGVAEAAFLMGTAFDEGLGVAEDPSRAAAWFHRASTLGNVLADHNLGNAYAAGRGVPLDLAHAVYWWLRAAERGDAIPQFQLGQAYEEGRGVAVDLEAALRWYRDAAGRGNAAAREAVARLESR